MTRILYVGSLSPTGTCWHRHMALGRLGFRLRSMDTDIYTEAGSRAARYLRLRLGRGELVDSFNRALLDQVACARPDIVWCDKALLLRPGTVREARRLGACVLHYNPDNPFGPRRDPGWRHFLAALPEYDAHLVPRRSNLEDYPRHGARRVALLPFAFEPTVHYPPPDGWTDADRPHAVTFIGSPYDDRPRFLSALAARLGREVTVHGSQWPRRSRHTLDPGVRHRGPAPGDLYRHAIWRSRICLGFVTRSNIDDLATRTFELTAAGAAVVAYRTPDQLDALREGTEALFFSDVEECARHVQLLLDDPDRRVEMGKAAARRAWGSGYDNDSRIAAALDALGIAVPVPPVRHTGPVRPAVTV
ncbi:CgeB family protein [Rhodocista pekingensis]|uniref:Glycosyltransferase n=1 Tax=Rhodocista pekingensis TaxID=201185 RepID=A0ABW2KXY7_9PROT